MELLPKRVTVILSDKTSSTAAVTWDISKYEEQVKSTKRFNLTGVVEGTELKANIKVTVSNIYVTEIKTPEAITVPYGTKAKELNLPQNVTVIMSDNTEEKLPVKWDTTAYDGNVSEQKKYVFTGDVQYTSLTAAIEVTVEGLWNLV
jgi:asparagine synthetase A